MNLEADKFYEIHALHFQYFTMFYNYPVLFVFIVAVHQKYHIQYVTVKLLAILYLVGLDR